MLFVSIAIVVFFMIEPFRTSRKYGSDIINGLRPILTDEIYKFIKERVKKIDAKIREIARIEEKLCIGSHIYFAVASLIVIITFPMMISISAITVAVLGDAMAAIIGRKFGKHRFKNGKSIEGSGAFFITSFFIIFTILYWEYPLNFVIVSSIIGALIGTIVEFYNFPPNDNFSNQIFIALVLYLLTFL